MADLTNSGDETIWMPKGATNSAGMLAVREIGETRVTASPRNGGFLLSIPRADFEDRYERVDPARLTELDGVFEAAEVAMDSFEDGQSVPCYLNGRLWNGWERPFFLKEDFEAALAEGVVYSGEASSVEFDAGVGTFVEIMPQEGMIPDGFDRKAAVRAAILGGGYAEVSAVTGTAWDPESDDEPVGPFIGVSLSDCETIRTPDGPKTAYRVGNGWCWERAATPAPGP
jgi:hypothetical protein